jgi:hypothetical protein
MAFDIRKLNPAKIREQGKILQADIRGQGKVGSPIFEVKGGQLLDTGKTFDPNIPNQQFAFQFNPEKGLRPTRGGSFDTRSFFDAFPEPERQAAEARGAFGEGGGTPTVFQQYFKEQKAQGIAPQQIRRNFAELQQLRFPERFAPTVQAGSLNTIDTTKPLTKIPTGATLIADPKDLAGLREDQIFRDPTSPRIYKRAGAVRENMITPERTQTTDRVSLPGITTEVTNPAGVVESGNASIKSIEDFETETSAREKELTSDIDELLEKTMGQEELRQEELQELDVSETRASLVSIKNQIRTKLAAFNKKYVEIEAQPITMASIIGQQAQLRAVEQAEIMFLQAQAAGFQNDISFALEIAQAAVDAKFKPILEELAVKQAQLENIRPTLNKEEERRADALDRMYKQQDKEERAQKDEETKIQNQFLAYLEIDGGKDQNVMTEIQQSATVEEAARIRAENTVAKATGVGTGFSSTERKKLEQAGLLNAPRQEQLDFLFGEDDAVDEFSIARNFLSDNPDASEAEKKSTLLENTDLNVSDINALIDEQAEQLKPKTLEDFAAQFKTALQAQKDFGLSRSEAEDRIKAQYGEEFDTLPSSIKKAMEDAVVEVYGRTTWQNIKNFFKR